MKTKLSFQAAECTFDDVIFSNRNQAYGAYYLRKTYNKHLMLALLFVAFLFISAATLPVVYNYIFPPKPEPVNPPIPPKFTTVTLGPDFKIPEIKPPDINRALVGVISHTNSGQYRPVDTITQPIDETTIALANQQSTDTGGISGPIIFVPTSTVNVVPPVETIYTYVEEPATFEGGSLELFRNWVLKNYQYPPAAIEAGIDGRITLNFVVDQKGKVTDISILKSSHNLLSEEATKVLASSPKWQPAKQNGKVVKQRFCMQIKLEIR